MSETEFKVNEYLTLRLENKKTNIFIKGELFKQCKFLLISIPVEEISSFDKVESIDDAAELLDSSLHEIEGYHYNITPEAEFWAHCSNLQVWYENGYNTCLLHSNLAFSLLKKLCESGDPLANRKYKEEIVERFIYGNSKIQSFLIEEGYFDILSREEFLTLIKDGDIIEELEMLIESPLEISVRRNLVSIGFGVENGIIKKLGLDNRGLKRVPEIIRELKSLKCLALSRNSLEEIPEWIGELEHLEVLDVSNNQLKEIPDSIGNLQKLREIFYQDNKIKSISTSIGNLDQLELMFAGNNLIEELPESIGKLTSLQDFRIRDNLIKSIPKSIGYMKSLRTLDLAGNPLQKLTDSLFWLRNLRSLTLSHEHENFPEIFTLKMRKIVSFI